jgi:hypothetical protein
VARFVTRLLVRPPKSPEAFNGTLVVESLNVTGGQDVAPEYTYLAVELIRRGYAWVGISAQRTGVEGGLAAVAGPRRGSGQASRGLNGLDPAPYRDLTHPGDAYCYDIYTQTARALLSPTTGNPRQALTVQKFWPWASRNQPPRYPPMRTASAPPTGPQGSAGLAEGKT